MLEHIESLIGQAVRQSLIIDAYDTPQDGAFLLECLQERLYVLIEVAEPAEALVLSTLIRLPKDHPLPAQALLKFNGSVALSDFVSAGLDAEGEIITVRRVQTLRDLSVTDITAAVDAIASKTAVLRAIASVPEADEMAGPVASGDPQPAVFQTDAESVVLRG
ncbi:MAG: hypothetical protein AAGF76_06440 [Pseudomonadota bacterium]